MASSGGFHSITQLRPIFLGTLVEAKEFLYQVESTFSNELWPAISIELAKSNDREWKLQKLLDDSKLEHDGRARLESTARQRGDALIAELLRKNADLEAEVEANKLQHNTEIQKGSSSSMLAPKVVQGHDDDNRPHVETPKPQARLLKSSKTHSKTNLIHAKHNSTPAMDRPGHGPLGQRGGLVELESVGQRCVIARPNSKQNAMQSALIDVTNKDVATGKDRSWRSTRGVLSPLGEIPHESFLATPREAILSNIATTHGNCDVLRTSIVLEAQNPEISPLGNEGPTEKGLEYPRGHLSSSRILSNIHKAKAPAYKFNEPVRKKRDRDALLATDCKQCRKFYEAVVDGDASALNLDHCDHLKTVSRHRFQNLPPNTPPGFWNIGFDDSEPPISYAVHNRH